jgi:hypothetical protein
MSSTNVVRSAYRLILRLHPASFRDRFGDEMQWIFDEEQRQGGTTRLFFDGVVSLLRQRAKFERDGEPVVAGFALLDTGWNIAPRRFVEAGVTASLLLMGFMLLLGRAGKPFQTPACLPGVPRAAPRLYQAPDRIEALPKTASNRASRVEIRQIDNAAASAVRIARAAQFSSSSANGYCSVH